MSDDWTPEQEAYGCAKGRSCGCISLEEAAAAEAQLAELADAAARREAAEEARQ